MHQELKPTLINFNNASLIRLNVVCIVQVCTYEMEKNLKQSLSFWQLNGEGRIKKLSVSCLTHLSIFICP